ncbi:MAG: DUF885 family protein [Acidothermus sp.]|nr:DUF885 family protein [Acidothermus sp.]MCL6537261.1 DUF885 domain-containing protein [Acidothermus sp.]
MDDRLRAICDLQVAEAREGAGLHDYDGRIQDLSPDGVRAGLARLGGPPLADPHDEAHVAAFEAALRVFFGELEMHRRNPIVHLANLDISCYDREYAPKEDREAAKHTHLAAWPDAVDMAIEAMDAVPAPVAQALLGPAQGLAAGLDGSDDVIRAARDAHRRFVAHLEKAAELGPPDVAIGGPELARLMGAGEALSVDLGRLAEQADAERDRLAALLREACAQIDPDATPAEVIERLLADHPDAGGVLVEAQEQVEEVLAFTARHELVPYVDGECVVGPAPESRRWGMAMLAWAAPGEPDCPSFYWVTPPDPSWPAEDVESWLKVFSRTTLPLITIHEVSPGHFAHGRALRRAPSLVRQVLISPAFTEGWAHYVEELCVDLGFRAGDPRMVIGMAIEALVRVTRLAAAIGIHTGAMTVTDAAARFAADAFLAGPAALSEARRATFDPTYGRYTWGKLVIRSVQEKARDLWGSGYSHPRFHAALLRLGAPPLGLAADALSDGDPSR